MRLQLLRHLPVCLPEGVCYGASDIDAQPLTDGDLDRVQASLLATPTLMVSSPLRRCRVLADALSPSAVVTRFDSRLQEMNFGAWELQRWDDIDRQQIDDWAAAPWDYCPPGGERANDLRDRCLAALVEALDEARRRHLTQLLIVTHGGPIRVIRGHLLALPQQDWLDGSCAPGALFSLRQRPDGPWRVDAPGG